MAPTQGLIESIAEPGLKVQNPLANNLRKEVARLLGRNTLGFPGAQPVSFKRAHLDELRQQDYYVCEKSDGIRYLLYLTKDDDGGETQYLIDRKNDYWWIENRNLHFPIKDRDQDFHSDTILDGELVLDEVGPNGEKEPRYLVFDMLLLDGKLMLSRSLDKRLGYIKDNIIAPYKALFDKYPQELEFQPLRVEMKAMQVAYGIEMMFREVLPSLKHGSDGLIFTCRGSEYRFGTDPQILKWKPVSENSIDFRLELVFPTVEPDDADRMDGVSQPYVDFDSVPRAELLVYHGGGGGGDGGGNYRYWAELFLTEDEWETLKGLGDPLRGRVVECVLDEQRRWRLLRFRDDKDEANHVSTVRSVLESIDDSVSERELLDAAKGIKDNWKMRAEMQKQQRR